MSTNDDTDLRTRAESHERGPDSDVRSAASMGSKITDLAHVKDFVGPYRLIRMLGEGGFGVVFEAEQTLPVRRRVAVKVLKANIMTKSVLLRFEAERQALALMDHASIAKIYDAGETQSRQPYFVMELVAGETLLQHCDLCRLGIHERLVLFSSICEAVQHAHQKGVIHRDLKPSNIIVSRSSTKPVPKIIDFGIAKALGVDLTDQTLLTGHGHLIGTLEYMSPEQAEGGDVDTRTDVYALGVILYELLSGNLPFDAKRLRAASLLQFVKIVREQEPIRPSVRVSGLGQDLKRVAGLRGCDGRGLVAALRNDLDWIVMKSLEKNRSMRYNSVGALQEDIERCLTSQPVLARPPTAMYAAGKFVRRHQLLVGAAAVMFTFVIGFAAVVTIQASRIARERDRANRESRSANEVTRLLIDMFKTSDPDRARGESITAREVLDHGSTRIRSELGSEPLIKAQLLATMGEVYEKLGLYPSAESLLVEARSIRIEALGEAHPEVAKVNNQLGIVALAMGRPEEAIMLQEAALLSQMRTRSPDQVAIAETQNILGLAFQAMARYEEARENFERSLEIKERELGTHHRDVARVLNNLGGLLLIMGHSTEAINYYTKSLAIKERELGPMHSEVAAGKRNLGIALRSSGDLQGARANFERAIAIQEKTLGPDHPEVAHTLQGLASLEGDLGNISIALLMYERVLDIQKSTLGIRHPDVSQTLNDLGVLLAESGDYAAAIPRYLESLDIRRTTIGIEHPDYATGLNNLADAYATRGDTRLARNLYEQSLAIYERAFGDFHVNVAISLNNLGDLAREDGDFSRARALYERAMSIWRATEGPGTSLGITLHNLGLLEKALGRLSEARAHFQLADSVLAPVLGQGHALVRTNVEELASLRRE